MMMLTEFLEDFCLVKGAEALGGQSNGSVAKGPVRSSKPFFQLNPERLPDWSRKFCQLGEKEGRFGRRWSLTKLLTKGVFRLP